ncbi:carbon-nitrogen hydrolase family protein [Saccharopolyspora spinosa]|uniref:N-carbamoylputrescine amidase n=1 Tax=Saccharopolyspora spinosa TaxID=60894 RepID=A0A2N3Y6G5_SACSN|nr:carbon-nitrogen hydrolase family protein [Saccharopolyspora spinosa]PKW18524.1 N-carbamoylputrescine amidase [Saccharopolyspora spinosa]
MSEPLANDITVGVVQTPAGGIEPPAVLDLGRTLRRHDLIVFPEMANTPYFPLAGVDPRYVPGRQAFPLEQVLDPYQVLARRLASNMVVGVCFTDGRRVRNAAVVLDRQGELVEGKGSTTGNFRSVYDKTHLCNVRGYGSTFVEDDHFHAGPELLTWDLDFARIGVLICYDRHFPGAWATLTANSADIVAVPTASPEGTKPVFAAEMQAMALQQSVLVAVANRHGREALGKSDVSYLGQSMIIGPDGRIVQIAGTGSASTATATFAGTAVATTAREMGMRGAQRPDLYTYRPTS